MEELVLKAMDVANDTPIEELINKLPAYSMRSNIEWEESQEKGVLRWALRKHINRDIRLASFDLEHFIRHFS